MPPQKGNYLLSQASPALSFLLKRANPDEDDIIGTKGKSQRYFQNLTFMKLEQKRKVRVTELWILLPLWL